MFLAILNAKGELQHLLPPELSAQLNWSTLKLEPGAFVDEELRASYSDLLFSIDYQGQLAYLYFLLEHQTLPERFFIFRQLKYVVRIWDKWLRENPTATHLPIIIPMLLCHGRKPWIYPLRFEELVNIPQDIAPVVLDFIPKFRVAVDDLSTQSHEALRERAMTEFARVTLWSLKTATNTEEMLRTVELWATHLHALRNARNGAAALATVIRYVFAVHERPEEVVLTTLAKAMKMEDNEVMATVEEQLIAKGRQRGIEEGLMQGLTQGREQGLLQGREQGLTQGQRAVLLRQLERKFGKIPAEFTSRVEAAPLHELETWLDRVLVAQSLSQVFNG
ncbi:MAG: Rpn family recombination-promoting nuclease/putative transposase [Polyangiaceae bacterium]|nr:Rpn family recombination-promoting nuclease/putative transposase [Polyangiaceae bacterium]